MRACLSVSLILEQIYRSSIRGIVESHFLGRLTGHPL